MYTVDDHIPKTPPTVKDVLLKRWAKDTVKMAKAMISLDIDKGFLAIGADDEAIGWSKNYNDVLATQIAYLNSAAEGATK